MGASISQRIISLAIRKIYFAFFFFCFFASMNFLQILPVTELHLKWNSSNYVYLNKEVTDWWLSQAFQYHFMSSSQWQKDKHIHVHSFFLSLTLSFFYIISFHSINEMNSLILITLFYVKLFLPSPTLQNHDINFE